MYQNYDAIKLLVEERHREQLNLAHSIPQLNGGKNFRIKSWFTSQFGIFREGFIRSFFGAPQIQKPIRSTDIGVEFSDCQTTSGCNTC